MNSIEEKSDKDLSLNTGKETSAKAKVLSEEKATDFKNIEETKLKNTENETARLSTK